jgi:hypothetical protein
MKDTMLKVDGLCDPTTRDVLREAGQRVAASVEEDFRVVAVAGRAAVAEFCGEEDCVPLSFAGRRLWVRAKRLIAAHQAEVLKVADALVKEKQRDAER